MHDKKRDLLSQTRIITEVYFFVVCNEAIAPSLSQPREQPMELNSNSKQDVQQSS